MVNGWQLISIIADDFGIEKSLVPNMFGVVLFQLIMRKLKRPFVVLILF